MKKILYSLIALCLCACGQNEDVKTSGGAVRGVTDVDATEGVERFSVLGIEMGVDIDNAKRILAKRVDDIFTDEAIVLHTQQVGPTRFHEIKLEFVSFRGNSALESIEMIAELEKEEARYFTYFWNKEFESKYQHLSKTLDREIECDNLYKIDNSTNVNVEVSECGRWYDCKIRYRDWDAGNKVYGKLDPTWLDNYIKEVYENRYLFTEY